MPAAVLVEVKEVGFIDLQAVLEKKRMKTLARSRRGCLIMPLATQDQEWEG